MKNLRLVLLLACAGTAPSLLAADCCSSNQTKRCDSCACEASSKTFFSVRPMYTSVKPEMVAGFRADRTRARQDGKGGAFDFVFFGSKSLKQKRLASYFLPACKTTLIAGDNATDLPDLDSRHFNIFTQGDADSNRFQSTLCFEMQQSDLGMGLHYRQRFGWNNEETKGWWTSLSSSLQRVHNTVTMDENVTSLGTTNTVANTGITTMTQAFNQPAWCYGKIACECPKAKTGLADIEAKLGYEYLPCPKVHFGCYGGLIIPTGNKPKAVYVFEPIVGNGGHLGLATGMEGGYIAWENTDKERSFAVEYATHSQYLFKNTQKRSFDVKNKPWSRYMAVYANQAQAQEAITNEDLYLQTPGINVFTSKVKVTPRFSHNMTTAAIFNAKAFRIEGGYNLFCRQSECVKLDCPWPTGENAPAFKKQLTAFEDDPEDSIILDPVRTIGFLNVSGLEDVGLDISGYDDAAITEADLDLQSATHPAILTHTFYVAMGYRWDEINFPVHIDGGASYEFAQDNNTVLDRWALWAKCGFAF